MPHFGSIPKRIWKKRTLHGTNSSALAPSPLEGEGWGEGEHGKRFAIIMRETDE
jgi:hypothetical protein